MAFWIAYDHLGKLILLNALCVVVMSPALALASAAPAAGPPVLVLLQGGLAGLGLFGLAGPVAMAGFLALAREVIDERGAGPGAFFHGIRRHGLQAVGLGLFYVLSAACLLASAWFYPAWLGGAAPWIGYGLGALACWALLFLAATAPLAFAALVFRRGGVRASLRLGALLALANPGMALALLVATVLCGVAALAPPVLLLFSMAPVAVGWAAAYEIIARRHADPAGPPPLRDAEDDFLNRGWRDLLFPWKL
jgi:uncharacterized membrane protein YesL